VFERLLQIVVGSPAQAGHDVVDVAAAGQKDDRDVPEFGVALDCAGGPTTT